MIDVSGMPPEDIHIGLILFRVNYKKQFTYEFYKKFPSLRDYNKKSTKIHPDNLFDILEFFSNKRLRMVCYQFKSHQWKKHERRLNELLKEINPSHKYRSNFYRFNEKLMGILYYYAITQIGFKNQEYDVIVCHESGLDIWTVLKTVKKLAKRDEWEIRSSTSIRSIEHLLKMADYIAGSSRRLAEFKLNTIGRHTILKDPIRDSDLKIIFGIKKSKITYHFSEKNQKAYKIE